MMENKEDNSMPEMKEVILNLLKKVPDVELQNSIVTSESVAVEHPPAENIFVERQADEDVDEPPAAEDVEPQAAENVVQPPPAKKKRLKSANCDNQHEASCQFECGADICKCVEELIKTGKEADIILPSTVTDKEEIFFPQSIKFDEQLWDTYTYGKWLIFTNGNLQLQNHLWIQLQNLIKCELLILLCSSTAKLSEKRDSFQGVIMCFTCKDIKSIREAGLAIQNILKDDTILNYKTNKASQNNLYRANGDRNIAKFMITVNGKLYKKDKLFRWTQITDTEYDNYVFEENSSDNHSANGSSFDLRTQSNSEGKSINISIRPV